MKVFVPEANVKFQVEITCPYCKERQPAAEKEVFRLFGKMIVCELEWCHNYFKLPEVSHETTL